MRNIDMDVPYQHQEVKFDFISRRPKYWAEEKIADVFGASI